MLIKLLHFTYLVDERKVCTKRIRDVGRALCTTSVGTDNHTVVGPTVFGDDLLLNVLLQHVSAVEVVDRDVEEALILRIVQIHSDDVVCAGASEKVGDECASLGNPLLVALLHRH